MLELANTGLVEELAGNTKHTIFAPTKQAFEAMQQDVAELLKPENVRSSSHCCVPTSLLTTWIHSARVS